MNWTSYKVSCEIHEQTSCMQKTIQSQPTRQGRKDRSPAYCKTHRLKQAPRKGRRLWITARRQQQTRKMPRRNLKHHKTHFVTGKVQWDLNESTTPKRRTTTSVASLRDGELWHQNFIVSGFKLELSQATSPFLSHYLHYLFFLFPLYSFFFF